VGVLPARRRFPGSLDGALRGTSIQFTAQIPVYQRVNGTQLVEDFNITMALRYTFDAVKQD